MARMPNALRVLVTGASGWALTPSPTGTHLVQTARYRPRGLWGRVYWYAIAPFHRLVFPGLVHGIARDAEHLDDVEESVTVR